MSDYKKQYSSIKVLEDDTGGLVTLSLVERHGQDRKSKIMNNFIGQLSAADPKTLAQLARLLHQKLPAPRGSEVVVGLMTSGVVLSAFLAFERGVKFNYSVYDTFGSTREIMKFSEDHRSGKLHYLYGVNPGDKVVIVEDEVWSGNGIVQLVEALREFGAKVVGVASVIEVLNFKGSEKISSSTGLELHSLVRAELSE